MISRNPGPGLAGALLLALAFLAIPGFGAARPILTVVRLNAEPNDEKVAPWASLLSAELSNQLDETDSLLVRDDDHGRRKLALLPTDVVTRKQAVQIGRLVECDRVLFGRLAWENSTWTANVHLLNPATTEAVTLTAKHDDWWKLRNDLLRKILQALEVHPNDEEQRKIYRRWTTADEILPMRARSSLLYSTGGDPAESVELCRKMIELDPDSPVLWASLASFLFASSKIDECEVAARRALELDPTHRKALLALVSVSISRGPIDKLEEHLDLLLHHHPAFTVALRMKGELLSRRDRNPREGLTYLQRARDLAPYSPVLAASMSTIFGDLGNREGAERALQEAVTLAAGEPPLIDAERFIASAAISLRDFPQTLLSLRRAIAQAEKEKIGAEWIDGLRSRVEKIEQRLTMIPVEAKPPPPMKREDLSRQMVERLELDERVHADDPLAITPPMRKWARELVRGIEGEEARARRLFDTLSGRLGSLSNVGHRTAKQVFTTWEQPDTKFSCQEYAKLFVALGREVGLDTFLVEVNQDFAGKWIYHSCAALFLDDQCVLVDPAYAWFGVAHKSFRILDDLQAYALQIVQSEGENEGVPAARTALKLDPDWLYGIISLAYAQINAELFDEAKRTLDRAAAIEPTRWDLPLLRALLASKRGNHAEAQRVADIFVEAHPRNSLGRSILGQVLAHQGKFEEARENLRECLRLGPQFAEREVALRRLAILNEHLGAGNESPVSRALQHSLAGNLEEAARAYGEAAENDPTSADLQRKLGRCLLRLGRPQDGLASLKKYLELLPEATGPHWKEVAAYLQKFDLNEESLQIVEEGLQRFPDDAHLLIAKSSCLWLLDSLDRGLETIRHAAAIHPDSADVRLWHAYLHANSGAWDLAERELKAADSRAQLSPEFLTARMSLLKILGRFEEAKSAYGAIPLARREKETDARKLDPNMLLKIEANLLALMQAGRPRQDVEVVGHLENLSAHLVNSLAGEAEINSWFDANRERLVQRIEKREVTIISIPPGKEVAGMEKTIRDRLAAGSSLAEATKEYVADGKLRVAEREWAAWNDLVEILREPIFETKVGALSATVTRNGYLMFAQVHGKRAAGEVTRHDPRIRMMVKREVLAHRRRGWEDRYWGILEARLREAPGKASE